MPRWKTAVEMADKIPTEARAKTRISNLQKTIKKYQGKQKSTEISIARCKKEIKLLEEQFGKRQKPQDGEAGEASI